MGAKVSSLVFRPPRVTIMSQHSYFYLDVDVVSPLSVPGEENGCMMGGMCTAINSADGDLQSIDNSFLGNDMYSHGDDSTAPSNQTFKRNVRKGVKYRIPAFFIRRSNATQTILFSHGNAEDLGMMFARMKELAVKLGVNIMAYDYTGYGLSLPIGEAPSENMVYRNIEAAYAYLTQVRKIEPSSIILYGRSLGGGPSCYLAAKTARQGQSVGGLILHSAFLSVYKVVTDMNGLDMRAVGDMFNNEKRAYSIRCPTFIIHGKRDVVVPFWHAPRLLSAIPEEHRWKPLFLDDLGHNSIELKAEMYLQSLTNFINGIRIMKEMNAPIHHDFRASKEDAMDNVNFYVNTVWLKHAKVALTEAIIGKKLSKSSGSSSTISTNSGDKKKFVEMGTNVEFKRGRTFDPSISNLVMENALVSNTQNRSFNGYCDIDNLVADARDEEDEFAPWNSEMRQQSSRPTSPAFEPARLSTPSPTPPRESTPPRREQTRQMVRRSQSATNDSEHVMKQQQQKDQKQYRKSHSMQLQAVSQSRRRSSFGRSSSKGR